MPEYLRVRDTDTGHEFSIVASALRPGLTPVDKPATRADGTPLPPKHHKKLSSLSKPVEPKPAASRAKGTRDGHEAATKEGA